MKGEQTRNRIGRQLTAKAAAWVLFGLVLYVSAYYALVIRAKAKSRSDVVVVIPIYPAQWMHVFFEPMYQFDRSCVRPNAWAP